MNDVIWKYIIKKNIDSFKKYLDFIKYTIKWNEKQTKKEEIKAKKAVVEKKEVSDNLDDYLACLSEDHEQLEQRMYQSFIINTFTFIEVRIIELCKYIEKEKVQLFSYTDLSGMGGIGKAVKYLKKVLTLDKFPTNQKLHDEFEVARLIRNAIVHKEGKIKEDEIKKINKIYSEDILYINQSKEIVISSKYGKLLINLNQNICDEISQYFKQL